MSRNSNRTDRIRLSIPFLLISFWSTASMYLLAAGILSEFTVLYDFSLRVSMPLTILLSLFLGLEDYSIAVFSRRSRNYASGKIREIGLLLVFLYIFGVMANLFFMLVPASGQAQVSANQVFTRSGIIRRLLVPDGSSGFLIIWGMLFWFSQSGAFQGLLSRLEISKLLDGRSGKEITRILQDDQLLVQASYSQMVASRRSSSFRLVLTALLMLMYWSEIPSASPGIITVSILSIAGQLHLAAITRMYAQDHSYLAYGALPDDGQRRLRSTFIISMILLSGLVAIPLSADRSIIPPSTLYQFLVHMFEAFQIDNPASQVEEIEFIRNQFMQSGAANWDEFISRPMNPNAQFVAALLDNILIALGVGLLFYVAILPLFKDPEIPRLIKKLLRSKGVRDFFSIFRRLGGIWLADLLKNIGSVFSLPVQAVKSFLSWLTTLGKTRPGSRRKQSESEQKEMIQEMLAATEINGRSREKRKEVSSFSDIFQRLVLDCGELGLEIRPSNTIREISRNIQTLLLEFSFESPDYTGNKVLSESVQKIASGFEESLFSPHLLKDSRLTEAKQALIYIRDFIQATGQD